MQVIHFTAGATDRLSGFRAHLTRLVPLARGKGDLHVCCLHLMPGARIIEPPTTHDSALLVVHGQLLRSEDVGGRVQLSSGMGAVIKASQLYRLESSRGAIVLTVEAKHLKATEEGICTPARIMGQRWPGEGIP
jgi:hypothetical protein